MSNIIKLIVASAIGLVAFKLLLHLDGWMILHFKDEFLRVTVEIVGLFGLAIILCAIIEKYISFD